MTVIYQPDGRIRVDDPHDALLLSLAGVDLFEQHGVQQKFLGTEWADMLSPQPEPVCYPRLPLYVPAEIAKDLVRKWQYLEFCWWDDEIHETTVNGNIIYMKHHNNRWNVLPDIKMEAADGARD